uniref:Uncharacterized protein n=1 Tax=Kalanchoe fedtschenkoi TaxID=63787 RepID=A0A7N0VIB6_KALFE
MRDRDKALSLLRQHHILTGRMLLTTQHIRHSLTSAETKRAMIVSDLANSREMATSLPFSQSQQETSFGNSSQ